MICLAVIESLEFPFVAGGCWYSGLLSQGGRVGGIYRRVPTEVEFNLPEKTPSNFPVLYPNMVAGFNEASVGAVVQKLAPCYHLTQDLHPLDLFKPKIQLMDSRKGGILYQKWRRLSFI